jgi:hypothetical protein
MVNWQAQIRMRVNMIRIETVSLARLLRPPWVRLRVAAALLVFLASAACGTDVEWLLERDGRLVSRADKVAARAEAIDPDLTTPMYDAEDAKRLACESIYASIAEQITRPPSFGEELAADTGAFVAYLLPIPAVERCADAQAKYQAAVEALESRADSLHSRSADGTNSQN